MFLCEECKGSTDVWHYILWHFILALQCSSLESLARLWMLVCNYCKGSVMYDKQNKKIDWSLLPQKLVTRLLTCIWIYHHLTISLTINLETTCLFVSKIIMKSRNADAVHRPSHGNICQHVPNLTCNYQWPSPAMVILKPRIHSELD